MEKHELASYLASLITIMDSMDDAGARLRPAWLAKEYERAYEELKQEVEKSRETGQSKYERSRKSETGADLEGSESGRSGPAWPGDGDSEIGNDVVRRPGL